jgi:hypothetical protein
MAGKNKTEKGFRLWWDDLGTGAGTPRDLSGDLVPGSCTGGGLVFDEVEMTGVSNAVKNYLAGHADSEVSAQFHMNDTATTGAFTVLTGSDGGTGTLTLQWGAAGAAPTTGDPEWEGEYVLLDCSVNTSGGKAIINARWKPTGATPPAWGTYT